MRKTTTTIALVLIATLWLGIQPAFAHTEFSLSEPTDQSLVTGPVDQISVAFIGEAEPAGEGFVVVDSLGEVRQPDRVTSVDNLTWILGFDAPLPDGPVGVRWKVAAPDAHPIEGSFSFTVEAPPSAPEESQAAQAVSTAPAQTDADLEAFLAVDDTAQTSINIGLIGRLIGLASAMLGIGGLAFAALVLRGEEPDIRKVLFWVRRAAVLLAAATFIEVIGHIDQGGDLFSPFGGAVALRLLGAGLLSRVDLGVIHARQAPDPLVAVHGAISSAVHGRTSVDLIEPLPLDRPHDHTWHIDHRFLAPLAGVGLLLVSYTFDGHTVTEGSRWLTALVDIAHVAAGAVWAGGLVMVAYVVWQRHLRGADVRALHLAVRFSVVAAIALVIAGIAGSLLAIIILDDVRDLWATPWGRLLLAKVAVVAVAAAAGGYNHRVLIPKMAYASPDNNEAAAEFRRTVTLEAVAMGLIIALTAFLVGAGS